MVRCRCLSFSLIVRRFDTRTGSSHSPMCQPLPIYPMFNTRSVWKQFQMEIFLWMICSTFLQRKKIDVEFELVYCFFLAQELVVKISFEKLTLFIVLEWYIIFGKNYPSKRCWMKNKAFIFILHWKEYSVYSIINEVLKLINLSLSFFFKRRCLIWIAMNQMRLL